MRSPPSPTDGGDVVVNATTGSGKGLLLVLPALADWAAAEPRALGPIDLVTVPYTALGVHLEGSMNDTFAHGGHAPHAGRDLDARRGGAVPTARRHRCADRGARLADVLADAAGGDGRRERLACAACRSTRRTFV